MPPDISKPTQIVVEDHASPMSDIVVSTPTSQDGAPSPLAQVVKMISNIEMSRLLLEGRHDRVLQFVTQEERT